MAKLAFLLGLIVLVSASTLEDLKKIDSDEYGKTLIDTIQIEMQTGEPIQRFGEVMRQLETSIEEEQSLEDRKNQEYQSRCVSDLNEIEQDKATLEGRITEIKATLEELNDKKSKKEQTQSVKNMWKEELEGKINELVAAREDEAQQFDEKMKQVEYAEYVFETLKQIFKGESKSFLQMNEYNDASAETLKSANEHLQKAAQESVSFVQKRSYSSIFKILSQILSNMDQIKNSPLVNKVISLCDQALKTLEETKRLEQLAETKRINTFQKEKDLYDKDLQALNTDLSRLNAEIVQLNDQIDNYTLNLNETNSRYENKCSQYKDRDQDCRESAFEYEAERKKREQKRQLVSEIIGIFSGNQRDFQAYIKQRAAAGDFGNYDFEVLGTPDE